MRQYRVLSPTRDSFRWHRYQSAKAELFARAAGHLFRIGQALSQLNAADRRVVVHFQLALSLNPPLASVSNSVLPRSSGAAFPRTAMLRTLSRASSCVRSRANACGCGFPPGRPATGNPRVPGSTQTVRAAESHCLHAVRIGTSCLRRIPSMSARSSKPFARGRLTVLFVTVSFLRTLLTTLLPASPVDLTSPSCSRDARI